MDNGDLKVEVIIFRKGKEYYITYDGKKYLATPISINSIKSNLKLPYKVLFLSCPRSFIGKSISILKDDTTDVSIYKLHNSLNGAFRYEAVFKKKEKINSINNVKRIKKSRIGPK